MASTAGLRSLLAFCVTVLTDFVQGVFHRQWIVFFRGTACWSLRNRHSQDRRGRLRRFRLSAFLRRFVRDISRKVRAKPVSIPRRFSPYGLSDIHGSYVFVRDHRLHGDNAGNPHQHRWRGHRVVQLTIPKLAGCECAASR